MRKIFSIVPIMKKMAPVLFASVLLLPLSAHAEIKAGSVEVSPFLGVNLFEKRQNLENGPVFGGRLGYNFTGNFGIEATGEYIKSNVDNKSKMFTKQGQFTRPMNDVDIIMYHLDLVYHFMPESKFNPFITAGYGAAHYNPEKINNGNMSIVDFGVGAKYWVADNIALRFDLRDNLVLDETIHNLQATVGVVFAFGGNEKQAATPVAKPVDSDGDGVTDEFDKCPGTPAGIAVDRDGCPLDSDGDGVPDYLDKCPDTPAGVAVDKDGCPPVVKQKVVILVSEPKAKEKVLVVVSEKKAAVVVLAFQDIHFGFDQSSLTPEAKVILKRDIKLLKDNPHAKIRVAGYTSASGTEGYNQKLSERRAKAVQEYLVSEGVISKERLSTIGYGETHPAVHESAPKEINSPEAKENMRVLFEIIVE
jgi:OOP family OmpA-OmpF porin